MNPLRGTNARQLHADFETLEPEQMYLLKAGETAPTDGTIVEGTTTMDEHAVTGIESVEKFPGSRIYAGTSNLTHAIIVRVSATREQTLHHKIASFKHSLARPPKKGVLHTAQKILRGHKQSVHEKRVELANAGIYVHDESTLKKLAAVDWIVFDKTGIITTGARHIEHVVSFRPYTQQQLLNTAAALESQSKHMTAAAIVGFAKAHGASALQRVENVKQEGSGGISGILNGKKVLVGSGLVLQKKKIKIPKEALTLKENGFTVVYIVIEKDVAGYLAVSNPVKKNAKEVLQALKQQYRTAMFSGEHEETAAAIAKQVFMHEVIADVHDTNRNDKIRALKNGKKSVAYVTALHTGSDADVTITMGTRHAFMGDVTILHGNLQAIQTLFETVRKK